MYEEPEDVRQAIEVLTLTVNLIVEAFNAFTLAIEQLNKRIEDLEGDDETNI